jgi:predicted Zn-dependent protease
VAVAAGALDPQHADSINKSTEAVAKTFEDITPSQEYYIGRSVSAMVLAQYKPLNDEKANEYLNVLGSVLSKVSDKPQTFGGYHFLIMETDEVNAFAAPGGFILVSRGLINCCNNEDELAAVLAHEVAHIQHGHALQSIQKGRVTGALTILAAESAKSLGGEQLAELTTMFEGSLNDIIGTMVNSGYSRKFETQADSSAVTILRRAGYNPSGLKNMLQVMETKLKTGEPKGFGKTHPDPVVRIKDIEGLISDCGPVANVPGRETRFKQALARIKK